MAGALAPQTGHHTASEAIIREALGLYFDDPSSVTISPTTGGAINVVLYATTPAGERYILRIYNDGNKSENVVWELEILRQVNQLPLSFKVPETILSKSGATHVLLSNGAECCVFHVIPGCLASTTSPKEVGRATGELCAALSNVRVDTKGPIPPYWDIFRGHHFLAGRKELFFNEMATNLKLNTCRETINFLVGEIRTMEGKVEEFKAMGLPMQIIHADIHYDNVLVIGDRVSGILDFEFCGYDFRAMELAVALSKYVDEDEPLPFIEAFVDGYSEHGQLTPAEISAIPDLIMLRILSNVVYYASRVMAGEDVIESLASRVGRYDKRVRWIQANHEAIVDVIRRRAAHSLDS